MNLVNYDKLMQEKLEESLMTRLLLDLLAQLLMLLIFVNTLKKCLRNIIVKFINY